MTRALIIGSIATDRIIRIDQPLRVAGHHQGEAAAERIGGGAANTAMALARGGGEALLVSAVGPDASGGRALRTLEGCGVDCSRVDTGATQSTVSLVIIDPTGERTIINLSRAALSLSDELADTPCDIAYIRSADPRLTPLLEQLIQRIPVVVHIPPIRDIQRPATILLGSTSDLDEAFMADPFAHGREIAGATLKWVVITDGAKGAVVHGPHSAHHYLAEPHQVVDSTGAGDAFAAALLYALGSGESLHRAIPLANRWGAASLGYSGTIPPADFPERSPNGNDQSTS